MERRTDTDGRTLLDLGTPPAADNVVTFGAEAVNDEIMHEQWKQLHAARIVKGMAPFIKFTDEQWAAIQNTRDNWRADVDWNLARRRLETVAQQFWFMRTRRMQRSAKRDQVVRHLEHTFEISDELPDIYGHELAERVKLATVSSLLIYNDDLETVVGRKDEHREGLYGQVLDVLVDVLGGGLYYSPGGPTVRFMIKVLTPILGDETPRSAGIRRIIDRYERRAQAQMRPTQV